MKNTNLLTPKRNLIKTYYHHKDNHFPYIFQTFLTISSLSRMCYT